MKENKIMKFKFINLILLSVYLILNFNVDEAYGTRNFNSSNVDLPMGVFNLQYLEESEGLLDDMPENPIIINPERYTNVTANSYVLDSSLKMGIDKKRIAR